MCGTVITWRGPAPYHFLRLPPEDGAAVEAVAAAVTYGWGMVPVRATLGATTWTTSLWPRDGSYVLPLKDAVRRAEGVDVGDPVVVRVAVVGV